MPYQTQLEFLSGALGKCHLQLLLVDPDAPADFRVDLGLRRMLGQELRYPEDFYSHFHQAQDKVIYRLSDLFRCTYLFFRLPGRAGKSVAVIGPYLTRELTYERLLEESQDYSLTPAQFRRMERYYGELPVLAGENPLLAMLDAFADVIWGKGAFSLEDVARRDDRPLIPLFGWGEPAEQAQTERDMELLEQRYAQENELLWAVATGQSHKAELLLAGFSNLAFCAGRPTRCAT